jgi:prepilin-type N-terminal cleavage/methylation domain-containing protein
MSMSKKIHGFSLIEILIASAVLGSVLVGLSLLMGLVIRSDTQARSRVIAGDLAQSGSDFLRQERNIVGFGRFYQALEDAGSVYCLEDISESFLDDNGAVKSQFDGACDDDFSIEVQGASTKFKREAEVTKLEDDTITFSIEVSWITDADKEADVTTTLQLRSR